MTGQLSSFPNFDLLPGTQRHGQLGVFSVPSLPRPGTGTSEDVFNLLAIRGPTRGEGKPGIEPGSSDPQSSPLPLRHRGGQGFADDLALLSHSHDKIQAKTTNLHTTALTIGLKINTERNQGNEVRHQ